MLKLLLDQHLPHKLRHEIAGHEVVTAAYAGLASVENGELLRRAAAMGFDALITNDRGMEYEQNRSTLPIAVVVLRSSTNKIESIRPLLPKLVNTLLTLRPRAFVKVGDAD